MTWHHHLLSLSLTQVHLSIFLDWVRQVSSSLSLPRAPLSGEHRDTERPPVLVPQGPILHGPRSLNLPVRQLLTLRQTQLSRQSFSFRPFQSRRDDLLLWYVHQLCFCDRCGGGRAGFGQGRDRHGQSQLEVSRACPLSVCRHRNICQGNTVISNECWHNRPFSQISRSRVK